MNRHENEQKLIKQLLGNEQAEEFNDNFSRVSELLDKNPAPKPAGKTIEAIKQNARTSYARKSSAWLRIGKYAAAAAIIIVVLLANTKNITPDKPGSGGKGNFTAKIDNQIWQSADLAVDDESILSIDKQLEQIESELYAIEIENDELADEWLELSVEFEQTENNFWKGS